VTLFKEMYCTHSLMRNQLRSSLVSSDVTIIESEIEIDFFLKIELNRNRLFRWYFFDFDSRLYWRRQNTAASHGVL